MLKFFIRVTALVAFALSAMAADYSAEYQAHLQSREPLSRDEVLQLRGYHFLVARGFMAEYKKMRGGDYFDDQVEWLEKNGITYSIAAVESDVDEVTNARVFSGQILGLSWQHEKPLMLLTHSRGSTIALRTLLNNPDLQPRVGGWMAVQSPFEGVTFADKILRNNLKELVAKFYLRWMGIDIALVREFTTPVRDRYMAKNRAAISQMIQTLPVLTYGTKIAPLSPLDPGYYLHPTRGALHVPNTDGLVDYNSTFLRGLQGDVADSVYEAEVDHLGFVSESRSTKTQRLKQTQALFHVLLQKTLPGFTPPQ